MSPPRCDDRSFVPTCTAGVFATGLRARALGNTRRMPIGVDAEVMSPIGSVDNASLMQPR